MEPTIERNIKQDVLHCARCGQDHFELDFKPLSGGNPYYSHWALCPVTGEPILLGAEVVVPVEISTNYQIENQSNMDAADLIKKARESQLSALEVIKKVLKEGITQEMQDIAIEVKNKIDGDLDFGEESVSYDLVATEDGFKIQVTMQTQLVNKLKKLVLAYDPSSHGPYEKISFISDTLTPGKKLDMQSGYLHFQVI